MKKKISFQLPDISLQVKVVVFVAIIFVFFAIPFIRYTTLHQRQSQEDLIARNLLVYLEAFKKNIEAYGQDKWGEITMPTDINLPSLSGSTESDENSLNRFLENIFGTQKKEKKTPTSD